MGKRKNRKARRKQQRMWSTQQPFGFGRELASRNSYCYSDLHRPFNRYTPEQSQVITEFLMGKFFMTPEVAIRFAEYARAAFPLEIGGFCRVQKSGPNYIATDLMVFPQSATPTFWQMDGRARAKWQFQMRAEGRKDELSEWNCLIHSHPNMAPFLSGTDEEDIKLLGHKRHAWSIIMTSGGQSILSTEWRVHYFNGGNAGETPPILVKDIPVDTIASDWKAIHEEVKQGGLMAANPSEYVGEKSGVRGGQPGVPNVIRPNGNGNGNGKSLILPTRGGMVTRSIEDLATDDIPSILDMDFSTDGISLEGIREGSIVKVNIDPTHLQEFADPDAVAEMVGEEFEVDVIDTNRGTVIIQDTEFAVADLELVQE